MQTKLKEFLLNNLKNYISQNYLMTVSGGVDSVVLCHLFKLANLKFSIAHCNFQLREDESIKDEKFVRNLANSLDVPFYSIRFDTKSYCYENKKSIQLGARELRYNWFEKIKNENNFDFICTAHHQNDVLETMIYNLSNATSLKGLHGIIFQRNSIIRPLLFSHKSETVSYTHLTLPTTSRV